MRVFLAVLLACLATSACQTRRHVVRTHSSVSASVPNTLNSGDFITTNGSYTHRDSDFTHELDLHLAGSNLHWTLNVNQHGPSGSGGGSSSSSMHLNSPGDPWFVYVEAPDRLWFFDGKSHLVCRLAEGLSVRSVEVISGAALEPGGEPVPAELVPRLPAELQKLVPATAPKHRPSI